MIACKMEQCSDDTLELLKETLSCSNAKKYERRSIESKGLCTSGMKQKIQTVMYCFVKFTAIKDLKKYILWS